MSILQIKTELAFNELLNVIKQLDTSELEKLITEVISLQTHRKTASYPKQESELTLKINQGLLTVKRQAEQLKKLVKKLNYLFKMRIDERHPQKYLLN